MLNEHEAQRGVGRRCVPGTPTPLRLRTQRGAGAARGEARDSDDGRGDGGERRCQALEARCATGGVKIVQNQMAKQASEASEEAWPE